MLKLRNLLTAFRERASQAFTPRSPMSEHTLSDVAAALLDKREGAVALVPRQVFEQLANFAITASGGAAPLSGGSSIVFADSIGDSDEHADDYPVGHVNRVHPHDFAELRKQQLISYPGPSLLPQDMQSVWEMLGIARAKASLGHVPLDKAFALRIGFAILRTHNAEGHETTKSNIHRLAVADGWDQDSDTSPLSYLMQGQYRQGHAAGVEVGKELQTSSNNAAAEEVVDALVEALESASNGLRWYREANPEQCNESDGDMDVEIGRALAAANLYKQRNRV